MRRVVWKVELRPGRQGVSVPRGAEFLTIAAQGEGIFLWARVEPTELREQREIVVVGTGDPLESADGRYIGTAFLDWMVFHAFELEPR